MQLCQRFFLLGQRRIELVDALHLLRNAGNLRRACTTKVSVPGEHAGHRRRIALVEQKLQRFVAADLVGHLQLRGEAVALARQ